MTETVFLTGVTTETVYAPYTAKYRAPDGTVQLKLMVKTVHNGGDAWTATLPAGASLLGIIKSTSNVPILKVISHGIEPNQPPLPEQN